MALPFGYSGEHADDFDTALRNTRLEVCCQSYGGGDDSGWRSWFHGFRRGLQRVLRIGDNPVRAFQKKLENSGVCLPESVDINGIS